MTVRGEARGKGCKDKPTLDQREEGMWAPYTGQTLQNRGEPSDSGQQLITWVQKQAQPIPSVESCRPAQLLWGLGNPTGSPPPHAHPSKTEKVRQSWLSGKVSKLDMVVHIYNRRVVSCRPA